MRNLCLLLGAPLLLTACPKATTTPDGDPPTTTAATPVDATTGDGPDAPADAPNLSPQGNTVEAAANLYRMLREIDSTGVGKIAVMPIPDEGIGEAINDRLRRAAAPRIDREEHQ